MIDDVNAIKKNDGVYVLTYMENEQQVKDAPPASFEEAVAATNFGKFNIFLMLVIIPPCFSQVFETTAMSFVLPIAQCDLHLTLEDKGMLNAITFAGMITSGFFWGYLCDALGRKKIMVYGYLLNGFFVIMGSLSPSVTLLMVAKFFSGLIINGPIAAATSYLYEFHSTRYRARVQLVAGVVLSLGNVVLPLMAWAMLTRELDFYLFGFFHLHAWNVFLFICALAPILSGTIFIFFPESPKFLMSAGRNQEALKVFKKVYRINTGQPVGRYPIKHLQEETSNVTKKSTKEALNDGLQQIKSLFGRPHVFKLLLACSNAFILLMSLNTLKLWLPQLFQAINDYQHYHDGASSNLCEMLEDLSPKNVSSVSCIVNLDNTSVYINSAIIGMSRILSFAVAGTFVNMLGRKKLLIIMAFIAGGFSTAIYFAQNSETVLALSSINMGIGSVCENLLLSITLELFPTTLRTIAISLHMSFGRTGTIVGNVVFPFLLYAGCAPPFLFVGLLCIGCGCLSVLYPNTENKALK